METELKQKLWKRLEYLFPFIIAIEVIIIILALGMTILVTFSDSLPNGETLETGVVADCAETINEAIIVTPPTATITPITAVRCNYVAEEESPFFRFESGEVTLKQNTTVTILLYSNNSEYSFYDFSETFNVGDSIVAKIGGDKLIWCDLASEYEPNNDDENFCEAEEDIGFNYILPSEEEIIVMAKVIHGEAGICSTLQKEAVAWCICNRVDCEWGFDDDIISVITAPSQFLGYNERNEYSEEEYNIAAQVLFAWYNGIEEQRILPREYVFFKGDHHIANHFTKSYYKTLEEALKNEYKFVEH